MCGNFVTGYPLLPPLVGGWLIVGAIIFMLPEATVAFRKISPFALPGVPSGKLMKARETVLIPSVAVWLTLKVMLAIVPFPLQSTRLVLTNGTGFF
ncbi:MAG: hypothetical protein FWF81_08575 [Defluviitaleaceae bacterium]|nr:hypothetical protein [Defluviitaleaceae bacterium]